MIVQNPLDHYVHIFVETYNRKVKTNPISIRSSVICGLKLFSNEIRMFGSGLLKANKDDKSRIRRSKNNEKKGVLFTSGWARVKSKQ